MEIREARGSSQNTAPSNSRRNRNLLRVNMRRNSAKRGFGARCAHYAAVANAAAFFRRRAQQRYGRAGRLARVQSRAVCALLRRRFLCEDLSGDGPGTRRLSPEAAGQSAGRHYRAARLVRAAAAAAAIANLSAVPSSLGPDNFSRRPNTGPSSGLQQLIAEWPIRTNYQEGRKYRAHDTKGPAENSSAEGAKVLRVHCTRANYAAHRCGRTLNSELYWSGTIQYDPAYAGQNKLRDSEVCNPGTLANSCNKNARADTRNLDTHVKWRTH